MYRRKAVNGRYYRLLEAVRLSYRRLWQSRVKVDGAAGQKWTTPSVKACIPLLSLLEMKDQS